MTGDKKEGIQEIIDRLSVSAGERLDVFHHGREEPTLSVKVEKNSRGINFEINVSGASTPDQAIELIRQLEAGLIKLHATPPAELEKTEPSVGATNEQV